jgi:hypothetical protein
MIFAKIIVFMLWVGAELGSTGRKSSECNPKETRWEKLRANTCHFEGALPQPGDMIWVFQFG